MKGDENTHSLRWKIKNVLWFFRIPNLPSKPLRVTKEHLRLLLSLMYLSRLKAQYWFWVTLIHPQPFARLSPVRSGWREQEREKPREGNRDWVAFRVNNKMRKTLSEAEECWGDAAGPSGAVADILRLVTEVPDRRGQQILISSSGWQPISFQLSSSPPLCLFTDF